MSIKHITIINQYIGSPYHGMEYRHYYLAKNLLQQGYKVTLVSGSYSHLFSEAPQVEENITREIIDGIEYLWVKTPKYRSSKSVGRIWNMLVFAWRLKFIKEISPSHIIVSSPSLFPVKIGRKLADKFKTKFLFEVRDIWPLTLIELSNLSPFHPLVIYMRYYEKFAYRRADKIISLLPTAKKHYESLGMSSEKFVYLPNGIEMDSREDIICSSHIEKQIPKDKFVIAYSGTIGIANNLDYLIDAAYACKNETDIAFVLVGQGGEKERLLQRTKELNLSNIYFLSPIKKNEVLGFLSVVDVAFISLLPEKIFRFGVSPNKIFDYMYAKKPIIWAIEAGNNLVKDAECGISVLLNDTEQLKDAVIKLKNMSSNERMELGENGYNFVTRYHSYKMLSRKLIEIVEG